jgi:hypothetical protein
MTELTRTNHATFEGVTTPLGEDVRIECDEGYAIECGGEYVREMTISIERHKLPVRGRRYMLGGKLVKVADYSYDDNGALWVTTDAGERVRWDG